MQINIINKLKFRSINLTASGQLPPQFCSTSVGKNPLNWLYSPENSRVTQLVFNVLLVYKEIELLLKTAWCI